MAWVRHEARLDALRDDGTTNRAHLEVAARSGSAKAAEALRGPEFPDTVGYLWEWAMMLHGRSGVGMGGLAPLSYGTVAHWSALTGERPTRQEVEALMRIDAAMSHPGEAETEDK